MIDMINFLKKLCVSCITSLVLLYPNLCLSKDCGELVQTFWNLDKKEKKLFSKSESRHKDKKYCLKNSKKGMNLKVKVFDIDRNLIIEQFAYFHDKIFYDFTDSAADLKGGVRAVAVAPLKINFVRNKIFKRRRYISVFDQNNALIAKGDQKYQTLINL